MLGENLSPFLKIGTTFAESQSSGIQFVVRDYVNITCNIGAISGALAFRTAAGIPSGPGDLLLFKSCNKLIIPSVEKEMFGTEICGCAAACGRFVRSSLVKTE